MFLFQTWPEKRRDFSGQVCAINSLMNAVHIEENMKAVTYTRYGPPDVLQLNEIEKPAPKEGEVLVEVRAVALNAYDWRMLMADP